nr:MAG: hypothetical protein [Hubei toti-like virus 17]
MNREAPDNRNAWRCVIAAGWDISSGAVDNCGRGVGGRLRVIAASQLPQHEASSRCEGPRPSEEGASGGKAGNPARPRAVRGGHIRDRVGEDGHIAFSLSRLVQRARNVIFGTATAGQALACISKHSGNPQWYRALAAAAARKYRSDVGYALIFGNAACGIGGDGDEVVHLVECISTRRVRKDACLALRQHWTRCSEGGTKAELYSRLCSVDLEQSGEGWLICPGCGGDFPAGWGGESRHGPAGQASWFSDEEGDDFRSIGDADPALCPG